MRIKTGRVDHPLIHTQKPRQNQLYIKHILVQIQIHVKGTNHDQGRVVQFSPLSNWVVGGDIMDESAEILFQSFLQGALVSTSGTGHKTNDWVPSKIKR